MYQLPCVGIQEGLSSHHAPSCTYDLAYAIPTSNNMRLYHLNLLRYPSLKPSTYLQINFSSPVPFMHNFISSKQGFSILQQCPIPTSTQHTSQNPTPSPNPTPPSITLIPNIGVKSDCHASKSSKFTNIRQVHLIPYELFNSLSPQFTISPGQLGENITAWGIDLMSLFQGSCFLLWRWRRCSCSPNHWIERTRARSREI